ncbi:MAG: hypothetical protein ACYDHM_05540 [Acidiferrobacterales bacterium]
MAEEGVTDFHAAKRKAANRLNQPESRHLPSNCEIDAALNDYLRLFHAERVSAALVELRRLAVEAMHFLASYEPRLVGAVLSGNVTPFSEIQLHLSVYTPEEIAFLLQEQQIPYEESDRRIRFGGERYENHPTFRFLVDAVVVELIVFTPEGVREAPLSPVDGKPMRRANLREVEALLTHILPSSHEP